MACNQSIPGDILGGRMNGPLHLGPEGAPPGNGGRGLEMGSFGFFGIRVGTVLFFGKGRAPSMNCAPARRDGAMPSTNPSFARQRATTFGAPNGAGRSSVGRFKEQSRFCISLLESIAGAFGRDVTPGTGDTAPGSSKNVRKTYGTKPISRKSPAINCRHFWPAWDASGTDGAAPGGLFDPEMELQDGIVVPGVGAFAGMGLREPCGLPLEVVLKADFARQDVAMENNSDGVGGALVNAGHRQFSIVSFVEPAVYRHNLTPIPSP